MISPSSITALFKSVQENALPAHWSQGVNLTRGGSTFVVSNLEEQECVVHVRTAGNPLSPKVILWPQDQDWDCDCGDDLPCAHVAATVILLKRGELKVADTAVNSSSFTITSGAHLRDSSLSAALSEKTSTKFSTCRSCRTHQESPRVASRARK
jgi:SWIM zinc finger